MPRPCRQRERTAVCLQGAIFGANVAGKAPHGKEQQQGSLEMGEVLEFPE